MGKYRLDNGGLVSDAYFYGLVKYLCCRLRC